MQYLYFMILRTNLIDHVHVTILYCQSKHGIFYRNLQLYKLLAKDIILHFYETDRIRKMVAVTVTFTGKSAKN